MKTKAEKEIDKKVAEIYSMFGGEPVYFKNRVLEDICLFFSRWSYFLTKGLFYKVKYFIQRHTKGFDDLDKWNVAWYIARKAIPVLTEWRNGKIMGTPIRRHIESRHGEIIELEDANKRSVDLEDSEALSLEEWKAILDDIIFAFNFVLNDDAFCEQFTDEENLKILKKRYKRGMSFFSIYYPSLWD